MRIVEGGLLTTVQDLGRPGYQKIGVTPGGAMDTFSFRVANILVGNPEDAAGLEITLKGLEIEFTSPALIALTGADLSPKIADVDIPLGRAVAVRRGSVLTFGRAMSGCRAYLAVAGGIDVPIVMGSRSTHLRSHMGGHQGRALQAGDELPIGAAPSLATTTMRSALSDGGPLPFALSDRYVAENDPRLMLRTEAVRSVAGPHFGDLEETDQSHLFTSAFEVSTEADRMGYRLAGARLSSPRGGDLISSAVTLGAVQLPSGGEPIVLMADRQTTGGYPVIAQVITADIWLVAQKRPGDELSFRDVNVEDAHAALHDMESSLSAIRKDIDAHASS